MSHYINYVTSRCLRKFLGDMSLIKFMHHWQSMYADGSNPFDGGENPSWCAKIRESNFVTFVEGLISIDHTRSLIQNSVALRHVIC